MLQYKMFKEYLILRPEPVSPDIYIYKNMLKMYGKAYEATLTVRTVLIVCYIHTTIYTGAVLTIGSTFPGRG
jgi:hypothetical protein